METVKETIDTEHITTNQLDILEGTNAKLNKGENKTMYEYFNKQKLFRYSPSSVLLNWNLILLLALHKNWLLWFVRKNQY